MKVVKIIGIISLTSLFVLSGCATQQATAPSDPTPVVIAPADTSAPTIPVTAAPVVDPEPVVAKKPEPLPEPGSVASVVRKMETSDYTLYWREKNTYSYFIGGKFDAEYEPGKTLTVKEDFGDDSGVICSYDNAGTLAKADDKMKKTCGELMLTLDDELSD